jgi:hypothetical protein
MESTVVPYTAKWLMAELVRLLHALHIDEAAAIVDGLIEREVASVWAHGDKKRVLRTGMTWKQQTLVLLAILIAELRVNSRSEILPTYRVGAPVVARRAVQWSQPGSNR